MKNVIALTVLLGINSLMSAPLSSIPKGDPDEALARAVKEKKPCIITYDFNGSGG